MTVEIILIKHTVLYKVEYLANITFANIKLPIYQFKHLITVGESYPPNYQIIITVNIFPLTQHIYICSMKVYRCYTNTAISYMVCLCYGTNQVLDHNDAHFLKLVFTRVGPN